MKRATRLKVVGMLFVLPGLISYFGWTLYPIFYAFLISLYKWNLNPELPSKFVGLANYITMFQDPVAGTAFKNTVLYTVITVPGQMILGFLIAYALNKKIYGQTTLRLLYYLPVVTSWIFVSLIFEYLFSGYGGLVNYIFHTNIQWLSSPSMAMVPIYVLGIWKGIGWSMLIFLAGLQGVPPSLYEAAQIDGANKWNLIRHITIPLLRPTIMFELVMLTIGGFNVFLSVWVMTSGGPMNSTQVVSVYMFQQAFNYFNFGYGSALSVMLFVIVFIIAQIQRRWLKSND